MSTEELYAAIGGDYAEALGRLGSDAFVARFIVRFLSDSSFPALFAAWEGGDERAAFEAAHRAKGVCANLALTRLTSLTSQVCEALRPGNDELRAATDLDALMDELRKTHGDAVAAIGAFDRER